MSSYRNCRAERFGREGQLLLSHNQFALLMGLLDRANGTAHGVDDCLRAAAPYVFRFRGAHVRWGVLRALRYMPPEWVSRERVGRRWHFTLTRRGRSIIDGIVPARVVGWGPVWACLKPPGSTQRE